MPDEVYELVIKISPEGAEEANEQLDDVSENFEETADEAGKSAGLLDKFSKKWKGALGVIIAGLGVAAAGLASQIPIVSDLMDGFGAIIESVALKLDEELRPMFEPIVEEMFKLAEQIDESDSSLLGFLDTLDSMGGAREVQLGMAFERIPGIVDDAIQAFERIQAFMDRFGLPAAWQGIIDTINDIAIIGFDLLLTIVEVALDLINGEWSEAWDKIVGFTERTEERLRGIMLRFFDWFDDTFGGWIRRTVWGFQDFWANMVNKSKAGANDVLGTIESMVNRAIRALNKLPGFNIGRVSLPRFDVKSDRQLAADSAARRAQSERNMETVRNTLAGREEIVLRFDPPELARIFGEVQGRGVDVLGRSTGR